MATFSGVIKPHCQSLDGHDLHPCGSCDSSCFFPGKIDSRLKESWNILMLEVFCLIEIDVQEESRSLKRFCFKTRISGNLVLMYAVT